MLNQEKRKRSNGERLVLHGRNEWYLGSVQEKEKGKVKWSVEEEGENRVWKERL